MIDLNVLAHTFHTYNL